MDDNPSDVPADEFRRVGQNKMEQDEEKNKTFYSSSNSNSNYSDYSNNSRSGVSKALIVILVVIVLALIGGTAFLLRDKFSPTEVEPSPSPELETPVATLAPSPTPEPLDRSQYKIRILNGTSTSGLAASVSAKLKELGYQIDRTGNATNSAFPQTVVRAKDSATGLIEQLIQDLSSDYQAASSSALKSTDAVDAEVVIGAK
jgi:hypothetical protein